jgi:hypothetical protein
VFDVADSNSGAFDRVGIGPEPELDDTDIGLWDEADAERGPATDGRGAPVTPPGACQEHRMAAGSHIQLRGMSRRAFTIEGADGRLNEIRLCRMVSAETGVPSRFRRGAEVTAQRLEELSDFGCRSRYGDIAHFAMPVGR